MASSPSTTEFSILGLLLAGERSGYDLKQAADAGVGYVWTAAKSHVYAVLPRLVDGGYATVRTVAQERRPDKQVYRVTTKGRKEFVRWLEEPVEERPGKPSAFLLKVFFGGRMSREALVAHLERRRAYAAGKLAEFRAIEEEIRGDDSSYFGYVTLRSGIAQAEMWIRWADEILRELAER
ncbi:MAG TPA: PadR family transcriptional regulator [Gaiellaceae bacterium]|nr:PadR family transcriptional regulator [Gaiellaceae bacterium]